MSMMLEMNTTPYYFLCLNINFDNKSAENNKLYKYKLFCSSDHIIIKKYNYLYLDDPRR